MMDRFPVTRSQATDINKALFPKLNYIFRLRARMQKVGFPPDDPLFDLVCKAYDALHRLHIETHYLSCNGVGRPSQSDPPDAGGK